MKIPLVNNKEKIVDSDDFVRVSEYNWSKTIEGYGNATINKIFWLK
jgi:hypothetical protein